MSQLPHCDTLQLARTSHTLQITLNRPEVRNAMSLQMVTELSAVFAAAESQAELRAIVVRGSGGHFCAGGDIRDMANARNRNPQQEDQDPFFTLNRAFGQMLQQINATPKVVVAVVEGAVMGGGFGLACVADLTIAGADARFAMPETSLGLIPAQIAPFVVERIGLTQARRLALLGLSVGPEEACRLGIAHEQADSGPDLERRLARALERVRQAAPEATAATKALLHRVGQEPMNPLLDRAAESFAAAIRSDEGSEGTLAFMHKRAPAWAVDRSDNPPDGHTD